MDVFTPQSYGRLECAKEALGKCQDRLIVADVIDEDRKLVSADASQRVGRSDALRESLCEFD